ncbi:MAG: DUF6048 family protein [Thermoflavifilum sp.]|nr:DUF6048 family protein [Thermoflavifilum sp.]
MSIRNIFVCFISLCLTNLAKAQIHTDSSMIRVDSTVQHHADSVIVLHHDLRIGVDLSRIAIVFLQSGRKDAEISADMLLIPNLYGVFELGYNQMKINKPNLLQYQSHGYFYRLGVDRNFLPPGQNLHRHDIAYLGVRVGQAIMQQSVSNYHISDSIWGDVNGSIPTQNLHALWLEFVAGIKIQLTSFIDLGWSIRGKTLLNHPERKTSIAPYVIPGFGKGANRQAFDFNYSLFIRIPIFDSHYTFRHKNDHSKASP